MKNRFDLEQDIMAVSMIAEDIDTLLWKMMDDPNGPMTEDDLINKIMAIQNILRLRTDKLWDTFCQAYELDQYRSKDNDL
jgi:hypothetical protein